MAGTPPVTQFIRFVFEHHCRKIVTLLSTYLYFFDRCSSINLISLSYRNIDRQTILELEEFESKIPFAN